MPPHQKICMLHICSYMWIFPSFNIGITILITTDVRYPKWNHGDGITKGREIEYGLYCYGEIKGKLGHEDLIGREIEEKAKEANLRSEN